MSSKGCMNGCVHKKDIKVAQMKNLYAFRCAAQKRYVPENEIKSRCGMFLGKYRVKQHTLEEFLD